MKNSSSTNIPTKNNEITAELVRLSKKINLLEHLNEKNSKNLTEEISLRQNIEKKTFQVKNYKVLYKVINAIINQIKNEIIN